MLAPGANDYAQRFGPVLPAALVDGTYLFNEDADSFADYRLTDPDGNDASVRSNLVLRWEYRRGSTLYLVWAQQRDGAGPEKTEDAWSALEGLRHRQPDNQFMLKVTYWFSS